MLSGRPSVHFLCADKLALYLTEAQKFYMRWRTIRTRRNVSHILMLLYFILEY